MYGITKHDIEFIDFKLEYQKKYLVSRFFDFDDESKSALDFTYSANLNPKKYFAEMNNRIKSIFDYATFRNEYFSGDFFVKNSILSYFI